MVLADVTRFLRRRGLEYFRGFRACPEWNQMAAGLFYKGHSGGSATDSDATATFAGFHLGGQLVGTENGSFYGPAPSFTGFRRTGDYSAVSGKFYLLWRNRAN